MDSGTGFSKTLGGRDISTRARWAGILASVFLLWAQVGCGQIGFRPDPLVEPGKPIQIADHINLTLVYWDISLDRLMAAFTVENSGTEKFLMRGIFSILHQQEGSNDLAPLAFVAEPGLSQECASTLYGVVSPGETMQGTVCWEHIHAKGYSYPLHMRYSSHTIDPLKKIGRRMDLADPLDRGDGPA